MSIFTSPTPDDQHNEAELATPEDAQRLLTYALRVVRAHPDWQATFAQRLGAHTDAATASLIHEVLCLAEQVRARFPGQDERLLTFP